MTQDEDEEPNHTTKGNNKHEEETVSTPANVDNDTENGDKTVSTFSNVPKDTGWAWFCVLGCFIVNFMVVGGAKSFGVLFVELIPKFNSTTTAATWTVALVQLFALILGPVTSYLAAKYTARLIVFLGGLLMGLGFFLSIFAPNLEFLYFSYGTLVGVGSAMAYAPSIIIVGQYFEKRRSLANGLSVAGAGVGNFLLPLLIRWFLDEFALGGALLLLSGLVLHVTISGLLLRPPESYSRKKKIEERKLVENQPSLTSSSIAQNAVADRPRYLSQTSCASDVVHTSMQNLDIQPAVDNSANTKSGLSCCGSNGKRSGKAGINFDLTLFKNEIFVCYALALFFTYSGYPNLFFMLPSYAQDIGLSKHEGSRLVAIVGILDLIGRILFGFLFDFKFMNKRWGYQLSIAVTGIMCFFVPFCKGFVGLTLIASVFGVLGGAFAALFAPILAESLGVEKLSSAFGLAVMFMGASFMYAPTLNGYLRDYTGSWDASFYFCGACMVLSALILLFVPLAEKREKQKTEAAIKLNTLGVE